MFRSTWKKRLGIVILSLSLLLLLPVFGWLTTREPQPDLVLDESIDDVARIAISPDGSTLAAGCKNGDVHLWNLSGGNEKRTFSAHRTQVWPLVFSPDSQILLTGCVGNKTLKLWHVADGKESATLENAYMIHAHPNKAFSSDGSVLCYGSFPSLILWDIRAKRKMVTLQGATFPIAFNADGTKITTAYSSEKGESKIKTWNVADGKEMSSFELDGVAFDFSRFGDLVLVSHVVPGSHSYPFHNPFHTLSIYDLKTKENLEISAAPQFLASARFTPDARTVVSSGIRRHGFEMQMWNVSTGEERWSVQGMSSVDFDSLSGNGERLAASAYRKTSFIGKILEFMRIRNPDDKFTKLHVYDTATAKLLLVVPCEFCVSTFSPDGKNIYTYGNSQGTDHTLRMYKVPDSRFELPASTWIATVILSVLFLAFALRLFLRRSRKASNAAPAT